MRNRPDPNDAVDDGPIVDYDEVLPYAEHIRYENLVHEFIAGLRTTTTVDAARKAYVARVSALLDPGYAAQPDPWGAAALTIAYRAHLRDALDVDE